MLALGIFLLVIGSALIIGLASYGGVTLLNNLEGYVATRRRVESLWPSEPGDWGDHVAVPSDFKVFHAQSSSEEGQRDHGY